MPYIVPVNAIEFEPDQVSEQDRKGIEAILADRGIAGKLIKLFVSRNDGSYFAVTKDGEAHNTVHITLQTLTQKQFELGFYS